MKLEEIEKYVKEHLSEKRFYHSNMERDNIYKKTGGRNDEEEKYDQ